MDSRIELKTTEVPGPGKDGAGMTAESRTEVSQARVGCASTTAGSRTEVS